MVQSVVHPLRSVDRLHRFSRAHARRTHPRADGRIDFVRSAWSSRWAPHVAPHGCSPNPQQAGGEITHAPAWAGVRLIHISCPIFGEGVSFSRLSPGLMNPNSEFRRPKSERSPNSEFRICKTGDGRACSAFGLRISFVFRTSDFGFEVAPPLRECAGRIR